MRDEADSGTGIVEFADKYLGPYTIHEDEIIPECCPICRGGERGDKRTFALNMDEGVFVCHRGSCGAKGTFFDLMKYMGSSVLRGAKMIKKKTYKLPEVQLLPPTDEILEYFNKRKISKETLDAFKVSADSEGNIVFPFYRDNVLEYVKFRKPHKPQPKEKKEWQESNTRPILFGMDLCSFRKPLIVTEGCPDCLSLYEAGVSNVVSVPCGADNLEWIESCYDWLDSFREIILFGDNDEPGRKMVHAVAKRLGESRCRIVEDYPLRPDGAGCKDANEILYFCGDLQVIETLESAAEVPIKGVIQLADVTPIDPTAIPRIKTMIPDLDAALGGLMEGGLTVFTGASQNGKSTLSGLFLLNAIEQGYSVCSYSGELSKESFQAWINFQCAGSDYITLKYDPISGKNIPVVPYGVQERLREYYRDKFFLFDNNEIFEHNQSESILNVFTGIARRHGCKLFLVDNLMTSLSDSDEENKAQGKFVNALKKFANRYAVHVILVAHPRKVRVGEQLGKSDVSGNSAIVNLADSAIVVERPDLRIIKNRYSGALRHIQCCYCPDSRRIYQSDAGDKNIFSWDKTGITKPDTRADSLPEYGIVMAEHSPF